MEEDECDYGTPIGQVIKHINTVCKKPQIDDQLSEALDLFNERLNQQEKYLISGIFKINFAEAALFVQSSADLYGKKIDVLWDELLEFHTRLITYEYEHQTEKGKVAVSQDAIAKLEERRNRTKRRKKFKFSLDTTERQKFSKFIFDDDRLPPEPDTEVPEDYSELTRIWREFEWDAEQIRKVPLIIPRHMLQYYRLTNYHVLEAEDYEIIDPDDGEYNTLYSRVPSYHHVEHLFDYNDKGMLPDTNNIISKLRLTAYEKNNFLRRRKIPFDTPFEEYKDEYIAFRNEFFAQEGKKWQNMPLDTLEDLHKQLQFLIQREKEENGKAHGNDAHPQDSNDKIDILENSDDDSLFEISFSCDKDFMQSALFVRLEKLSSDIVDSKLRQDSGFYEFDSDSENDNDNTAAAETATNVNSVDHTVIDMDTNVDGPAVNTEAVDTGKEANNNNNTETSGENCCTINNAVGDDVSDNFETRSFISDHDYCFNVSNEPVANCVTESKGVNNKTVIETFNKPLCNGSRVVAKIAAVKQAEKKQKRKLNNELENIESPSKRRKLSQKQIENLLKSKIKPVKELKFEKFFSLNYQPEGGEGEILEVDYASGESDVENDDPEPLPNPPNAEDDDNRSFHSDHDYCQPGTDARNDDDTRSIYSDHNYCQADTNTHNDSGFLDATLRQDAPMLPTEVNTENDIPRNLEDEYQRLLNSLRDPGVSLRSEGEPECQITEEQKQKLESQARVQEWRNTINPILRNLKERDFDIHEYGSRIIDDMEVNETKPFSDMVQGKTSAEVVRFFISSLQLANTNNIEICGAKEGELSNDTYKVKLLSKDRYHEHLEEFLAPSVETLQEKLDKVQAMKISEVNSVEPWTSLSTQMAVSSKRKGIYPQTSTPKKQRIVAVRPSTSANKITNKKNVKKPEASHKVKECRTTIKSVAQENCNAKSNKGKLQNSYKGKCIIKKQPLADRSQKPLTLNADNTLPSTSYVLWSSSSNYTDSDRERSPAYSPRPPSVEGSQSSTSNSHIPSTSYTAPPPNKKRRNTKEESFREKLMDCCSGN